jgi:phosphoribosyl 1,2-cyclic phosphate phosphodiesterase
MIEAKVNRLDAVFLTHSHADHLHGLDDIRPLTWDGTVPVYANALTIDELRTRFDYIFKETQKGGGKPDIRTEVISGTLSIGGISIESVPVMHGTLVILAYIFTHGSNSLAYITDCSGLPSGSENTIKKLAACQTLILGALRKREHQTHFSFDQAFDFARELYQAGGNLRRVYLTHISHETSHKKITAYCNEFLRSTPALRGLSIAPAYDMQKIIPDEI